MTNPDERVAAVAREEHVIAIAEAIAIARLRRQCPWVPGDQVRTVLSAAPDDEDAQAALEANDKWLKENGLVVVPVELLERTVQMREDFWEDEVKAMIEAAQP